jgi:hypothetical protein
MITRPSHFLWRFLGPCLFSSFLLRAHISHQRIGRTIVWTSISIILPRASSWIHACMHIFLFWNRHRSVPWNSQATVKVQERLNQRHAMACNLLDPIANLDNWHVALVLVDQLYCTILLITCSKLPNSTTHLSPLTIINVRIALKGKTSFFPGKRKETLLF